MRITETSFWNEPCAGCHATRASHQFDFTTDLGPSYGYCAITDCAKFRSVEDDVIDLDDELPRDFDPREQTYPSRG